MTDLVKRLRGCGSDGCNPYDVAIEAATYAVTGKQKDEKKDE